MFGKWFKDIGIRDMYVCYMVLCICEVGYFICMVLFVSVLGSEVTLMRG